MPKPQPESIIIVRSDMEDRNWSRALDLPDDTIAGWAANIIDHDDLTELEIEEAEVVIRWTTTQEANRVAAWRSNAIPTYDNELSEADDEDRAMIERGNQITEMVRKRLRDTIARRSDG